MQKVIELHPKSNSGESAIATVRFEDRAMTLKLTLSGYGQHETNVYVNFDAPEDMESLANALTQVASEAREFFKKYP